ncbi:hypothetical protein [Brevibacillus laterosporus]|uniref:hypothetical protein n=1 Tax=Brevibacillus laterosporus TaxID=1465 RepID=UPI0014442730|nr:hypothetical protein [Brevibacillus laterosporus]NKQ18412.1 hypothetical protein [Brevibacillus laterosporus]WNX33179.1 hypothetical protein RWW94_10465 [Brevibacillus laterosporus]
MKKLKQNSLYIPIIVVLIFGIVFTFIENENKYQELIRNFANLNVTISLGYAALSASVVVLAKHKNQWNQNKKYLYGLIKAFGLFIMASLWVYFWSFPSKLILPSMVPLVLSLFTLFYLNHHFILFVRSILNIIEQE